MLKTGSYFQTYNNNYFRIIIMGYLFFSYLKRKRSKMFSFLVFEETKEMMIWEKNLLGPPTLPEVVSGWKEKVFLKA